MKKKALSLTLALAMCLGLTIPTFAEETATETVGGITITASFDGSTGYVSYTGSGELDFERAQIGFWMFLEMETVDDIYDIAISVNVERGIGINHKGYKDNDEFWEAISDSVGGRSDLVSVSYSTTPTQPQQPAGSTASNGAQVSNWAKDRVNVALDNALAPDGLGNDYRVNITRAQFAATAVKLYEAMGGKAEAAGGSSFTDTADPVILRAADLGFVSGVGGGKFSPDALVTREQAAVMLSSVYARLGGEIPAVESTPFADNGDVAGWARNAVAFMSGKEIVTGVGNNSFSPKGNASIEQALLISLKMFETLK